MKKFCSNCGNQLELSQRNCSQCGEVNPFFVAAFTILSDQTDALEKLKQEKEKIEKELQEKLQAQLEFERQEQIRKEQEEAEKIRMQQVQAAKKESERLEQERIAELIKREKEKLEKELEEKLQARLKAEREQQLLREQEEARKMKANELEIARREAERIETLLHQEKEKLARELQQKLESQLVAEREQRLKQEQEEAEKIRLQKLAADQIIAEQEKMEAALQSEILLVKQSSQEYQKQTIDLVNGVREELQQIEVENKRLKQEVENLHRILPDKTEAYSAPVVAEPSIAEARFERKALSAIIGFVFLIGAGLLLFYIINWQTNRQASVVKESANVIPAAVESSASEPKEYIPVITSQVSDGKTEDITAIAQPDKVSKSSEREEPEVKREIMKKPSSSRTSVISTQSVAADMVGQKISGCDILIRSIEEVSGVSGLKLIEKLPSGQLKYKFSATITQNKQTYRTSPYIYYQTNGAFIKLDGTNCE